MILEFPDTGEKYNFPDDIAESDFIHIEEYSVEGYPYIHTNPTGDNEIAPLFEIYCHKRAMEEDPGQLERCMYWSIYPIGEWADDPRVPSYYTDDSADHEAALLGDTGWLLADNAIYVGAELV